jgi:hypothetical protein
MRRRENRLKQSTGRRAREALEGLATKELIIRNAQTMREVDLACQAHRAAREDLRSFQFSKARRKDLHHQRLRTARTWARLAAAERRYVQEHARRKERDKPRKH